MGLSALVISAFAAYVSQRAVTVTERALLVQITPRIYFGTAEVQQSESVGKTLELVIASKGGAATHGTYWTWVACGPTAAIDSAVLEELAIQSVSEPIRSLEPELPQKVRVLLNEPVRACTEKAMSNDKTTTAVAGVCFEYFDAGSATRRAGRRQYAYKWLMQEWSAVDLPLHQLEEAVVSKHVELAPCWKLSERY